MKKILYVALCAILIASAFTGCRPNVGDETGTSPTPSATHQQTTPSTTPTAAPTVKPTTPAVTRPSDPTGDSQTDPGHTNGSDGRMRPRY